MLYAPTSPDTSGTPYLDKVVHVAVFGAVAVTALVAGVPVRVVVPLLVAHAVVSELVQWTLLPGRSGDPWDVVADVAGTALGTLLGLLVLRRVTGPAPRVPPEAGAGR